MDLWIIRNAAECEILKRDGRLTANEQWIPQEYRQAYRWMATQLAVRVGQPPQGCHYPLWAWYQWSGPRRERPDLRSRAHLPTGQRGVRIAFKADPQQVLLSDFDRWHAVLNQQYLSKNDYDARDFEQKFENKGKYNNARKLMLIRKSWEKIFDVEPLCKSSREHALQFSIQAVLWELRLDQVHEMRFFIAR